MKNKHIAFLVLAATALLFLIACKNEEKDKLNVTEEFVQGFIADDSKSLADILTKTYELQELYDYFGKIPPNEALVYGLSGDKSKLSIHSVNERFPIECLRRSGYSVYKVSGGGYYYVFWIKPFNPFPAAESKAVDAFVYFTAYLSALRSADDFDSIAEGASTAYDVAQIDSAFELSFLMSSGIRSYSILEDGLVLEIWYENNRKIESRSDLIVKSKNILSKDEASAAILTSILSKDLL
jgi:hypothetical protein